ncbi:uncharacterized protein LOC131996223 [Stomoxys calcitrans]|uniref:uncharacterized protein LOC131996223 n=1 Tax=Stomoxys calcitrans TaxID=35570 RepID=UPI0027E28A79|nr:uncharacterized protein LOC131996223 [Stomoxys calcitrans]
MKLYYNPLFPLIVLEFFQISQAGWKKPFTVIIDRLVCADFKDPFLFFNCSLKSLSKSVYSAESSFKLRSELNDKAELHLRIFVSVKGGKWIKFVNVKMYLCDFFQNVLTLPITHLLRNELLKNSNLPHTCPFKGNIVYNISDCTFSDAYFPPYTPREMQFNATLTLFEHKNVIAEPWLVGRTMP